MREILGHLERRTRYRRMATPFRGRVGAPHERRTRDYVPYPRKHFLRLKITGGRRAPRDRDRRQPGQSTRHNAWERTAAPDRPYIRAPGSPTPRDLAVRAFIRLAGGGPPRFPRACSAEHGFYHSCHRGADGIARHSRRPPRRRDPTPYSAVRLARERPGF